MNTTNKLPEPELGYIKTDMSNQPAFSARQMRDAMERATQAEVTDEQILSLDCVSIDSDEHGTSFWVDRSTVIKFARAILSLRPERVPMMDEQINEMALQEEFLLVCDGVEELTEIVRATEAYHGITAQATKET